MKRFRVYLTVLVGVLVAVSACAPAATPERTSGAIGTGPAPRATSEKKTLVLVTQSEPVAFIRNLHTGIQGDTGRDTQYVLHDTLAAEMEFEVYVPQLALELPSIERGTWTLNPDGTMDTIWKLRPNVKWQDGQPFTAADLLFTFQLNQDRDLVPPTSASGRMAGAAVIDDLTFTIRWSAAYVIADRDALVEIAPRHILEDTYLTDKARFTAHPYFTSDFVGLGPYRMTSWERGSYIEAVRFDAYHQGRPALDAITIRFVLDPNTAVANILAGSVDLVSSSSSEGVDLDAAVDIQRRWEGTGHQVIINQTGRVYVAEPQFRAESRPRGAMNSLTVRQALYHAIDRPGLSQIMTHGLGAVADSYFLPFDPLRPQMESSIPQFPYDLNRARGLLTEAGWIAGTDGVLTQRESGERFEMEVWGRQGGGNDKIVTVMADGWKSVGIAATVYIVPTALQASREYESLRPGFLVVNPSGTAFYESVAKLHTRSIPTAENRWRGSNYGAYSSPRIDVLIDRLQETVDPRQRLPLHQQLVNEHMANVAMMPLYWQVAPVLMLKGVKGPRANQKRTTSNIYEWDKN